MRAVVQRVSRASVSVEEKIVGAIDEGLLVLLAISPSDCEKEASWLARKLTRLRIFQDELGKMNLSLLDVKGSMLIVSQFTLYGNCRKGNRPSFVASAPPEIAEPLYERFTELVAELGVEVAKGRFGAMMDVSLVNDGPVTLLVDTPEKPLTSNVMKIGHC